MNDSWPAGFALSVLYFLPYYKADSLKIKQLLNPETLLSSSMIMINLTIMVGDGFRGFEYAFY